MHVIILTVLVHKSDRYNQVGETSCLVKLLQPVEKAQLRLGFFVCMRENRRGDEKYAETQKMDRDIIVVVRIGKQVPKEHLLRKIDRAVDFNRLYEILESLYCEDDGRPCIRK